MGLSNSNLNINETSIIEATSSSMYTILPTTINGVSYILGSTYNGIASLFTQAQYDGSEIEEAITKLKKTLAFLESKTTNMNIKIFKFKTNAKKLCKENRTAALHQIRLKKMYENEVQKLNSLKFNIESNILHVESAGIMMETVSTIKETGHHFQILSKHVDISKIENSIETIFEQRDTSKDIESILCNTYNDSDIEEDELNQELNELIENSNQDDIQDSCIQDDSDKPDNPANQDIIANPDQNLNISTCLLEFPEPPIHTNGVENEQENSENPENKDNPDNRDNIDNIDKNDKQQLENDTDIKTLELAF